jgi:DNA-binding transcriptional LysR family regulator
MTHDIGWELYRTFLGVLEAGSLSGAARVLGLTQPTVGRQVAALEKSLGLALFTRSPSGLMPTDAAESLRFHAQSMRSTAAALERVAASQGAGVQGTVRVTASDVIGVEVLPAILAALREQHPQLVVELVLTDRVQDLLRREADIAVRMVRPRQTLLVARRVGNVELGLFAHRRYLERHGTPTRVADLADHALIGFDQPSLFVRNAGRAFRAWQRAAFALRTDNNLAQLALIRAAAGIGVCQEAIARRDPSLVRLLRREVSVLLETWVTLHEDLRHSPRCRVVFDALVEGLKPHVR